MTITDADDRSTGLFSRDAVIRQVDSELVLLLGGPRALLMQLAHPLVAKGVAEHSGFEADPFSRLQRTLEASFTIVFGSEADAKRTSDVIRAVHDRVVGDGYCANDPELLLWVHSTLVDTAMKVHNRFLRRLTTEEGEAYYAQSMVVAELLGVPRAIQPSSLQPFRDYMLEKVNTLTVTDDAKRLAQSVLRPRVPLAGAPLGLAIREITAGLLPPPLRAAYGLSWDPVRRFAFEGAAVMTRQTLPFVPGPLRRARLFSRSA